MKLFYSPASPFVRKVSVLIAEAGITDIENVLLIGTPTAANPELIERNPLGKIPALVREDGPTLYDSRVICQFLDAHYSAGVYPDEPKLWDMLIIEATADGILDAAVLMMYEVRLRPEDKRLPAWVEGQWAKINRALDVLEDRWIDCLVGPSSKAGNGRVYMGQIAAACALGYLDFRFTSRDWRKGRGRLSAWFDDFSKRPSMVSTAPADASK